MPFELRSEKAGSEKALPFYFHIFIHNHQLSDQLAIEDK